MPDPSEYNGEELNEIFFDALDFIPASNGRASQLMLTDEPLERELLPYFKDPK